MQREVPINALNGEVMFQFNMGGNATNRHLAVFNLTGSLTNVVSSGSVGHGFGR
jgi:hypothetical protein